MKTAEMKIEVSGRLVVEAVHTVKLATISAENTTCNQQKGIFKKVPASELRLEDAFMKHLPKTKKEQEFKERVEEVIQSGLKDFWRPVYDPSFDDKGNICYESDKIPAVDRYYCWWYQNARNFWPERGSRLGTKTEYIAFLAVLIKELFASGKSLEWAWNAVCNDSKELGHYSNSKDSKDDFERTGSREICGWYDLANCHKILVEDENSGDFWYWCASGCYIAYGNECSLATLSPCIFESCLSVGWLVLTKGNTGE